MHLAVLHQASQRKLDEQLLHIQFEIDDFTLCELKGQPKELTGFELPGNKEEILWLCIQFLGGLTFPSGSGSQPDTIFSFISSGSENLLTVPVEKQWVLLLGVKGASRRKLLSEHPILQQQYDREAKNIIEAIPISNIERELLKQFSETTFGSFTTVHHIGLLLAKLYGAYIQHIETSRAQQGKDEGLIQLYHKAIKYITDNYMDGQLNLETVAVACYCSVRNLQRAFEGRPNSFKSSILLLRLYKGRELLHDRPELTVEHIAGMLFFSNAKHFATQYKKCFHRTPREERKTMDG